MSSKLLSIFDETEHKLTLDCSPSWSLKTVEKLKAASRLAFESGVLNVHVDSFETFWTCCKVPDMLSMQKNTHARRGRRKIYIPLYHQGKELTGVVTPDVNAIVQPMVRWCLHDTSTDDCPSFGWRAHFGGGIIINRLGAPPVPIREPWTWSDVDFASLSIPLYDKLIVKMPCMHIKDISGSVATVTATDAFHDAMQHFHSRAGADEWSFQVELPHNHSAQPGQRMLASITPSKMGNSIMWYVEKHRLVPGRKNEVSQAEKRCGGNTDNSESLKTKRQRI